MDRLAEIHLLSDGKLAAEEFVVLAAAVHPQVDYIHLREKMLSAHELYHLALTLLNAGVPACKLIINDRLDVAMAVGAAGVQLAGHSLSAGAARLAAGCALRLGSSVHSASESIDAASQGADYCLFGHVYPSTSKPGLKARGLTQLKEAVLAAAGTPVIALGGITPHNAPHVLQTGAAGIAVMSGICGAADPLSAAQAYRNAVREAALKEVREHESDSQRQSRNVQRELPDSS
ncbi:thiamine phosphate synthase [Paenibacillus camerounensis]|uniref:thiamine phosphate synthase n=1 Tax=Paenibacillus camerounensis TaxID=1243663 RepID=UPI0006950BC3|nr:thiamine phosphate synthase [Paenibacillus camerounensis]